MDDIQQVVGPPLPTPNPATLPITFESSVVSSDFSNFYGAQTTVISNPQVTPDNSSTKVGHFLRSGGQSWAQSRIQLTDFMDFSAQSFISMKVYTEAPVGTLLKFKVESTASGAANEKDALTTVSGDWETYYFNFAGDPPVYNVITLMLGYGSVGDAGPNSTFLFDDIQQSYDPASAGISAISEVNGLQYFPNPVHDVLTVSANDNITAIHIYDLLGHEVSVLHPNAQSAAVSVIDFPRGIYVTKIATEDKVSVVKFSVE